MIDRTVILWLFAMAWVFFASMPPSMAAEFRVLPVDEAAKDASLVTFRGKLLDAIARRDLDYVVGQASSDIKLSFGGSYGQKDFRKSLTLSAQDLADEYKHRAAEMREGYWDALEEVFRMGGQFTAADTFEAPYTWTAKLPQDADPYTTYLVITKDAPLRDRPSKYGAVISSLSYDIVTGIEGGEGTKFQKVKLASGAQGFVHEDHLRSSIDYRARLQKRNGKWTITLFISGD
ncbi:MAG: hypothetical protein HKN11_21185 [Rhizobiales bacterium]|nr:hypothetical protein [Hyphomicrobiales bacterium]